MPTVISKLKEKERNILMGKSELERIRVIRKVEKVKTSMSINGIPPDV